MRHPRPDEPAFTAPWQARAFAMTLALHEAGLFTWAEWGAALAAAVRAGPPAADATEAYYRQWLAALEALLVAKGVTAPGTLSVTRDAWDALARDTPHGAPFELTPAFTAR